jgi:DNA (cytosine-5)-methyltransferase 1
LEVVSLYSGILGLDIAAHAAGFKTVAACDSEPFCRSAIRHYLPDIPLYESDEDVTRERLSADGIAVDRIAAVIGGPPCQDASIAGRRAGEAGNRWRWPQYLRVVRELQPTWFVAENPQGILTVNGRRAFGLLLQEMADMGYVVSWATYGANEIGASHKRARVFIIGRKLADSHSVSQRQFGYFSDVAGEGSEVQGQRTCALLPAIGDSGADVADSLKSGLEGRRVCGRLPAQESVPSHCYFDGEQGEGQAELPLGRGLDGLSVRLARTPCFPAGPQAPQESWEPERLVSGEQDRVPKLRALGNAVVPAQAYPVFAAIAEIERRRNETVA